MSDRFSFVPHLGFPGGIAWASMGLGLFAWLHASQSAPFHYGGICGHGLAEPHCAGCYAAAAMVVTGLLAALTTSDPRRLLRTARAA